MRLEFDIHVRTPFKTNHQRELGVSEGQRSTGIFRQSAFACQQRGRFLCQGGNVAGPENLVCLHFGGQQNFFSFDFHLSVVELNEYLSK